MSDVLEPRRRTSKLGSDKRRILRARLFAERENACFWCGIPLTIDDPRTTVDHIVPRSEGGPHRVSNLVIACKPCNADRGDLPFQLYAEKRFSR